MRKELKNIFAISFINLKKNYSNQLRNIPKIHYKKDISTLQIKY